MSLWQHLSRVQFCSPSTKDGWTPSYSPASITWKLMLNLPWSWLSAIAGNRPLSVVLNGIFSCFSKKKFLTLHANFFGSALNVDPSRIYAMLPVLHLMIFLSSWIHSKFAAKCTIVVFINLWKLLLVNWWCCCAGVCGLCNGRILKLVLPED